VNVRYADGDSATFHQTPMVWEKDQKSAMVTIKSTKPVQSIRLEGGIFMDADEKNNSWIK
jgi:hypothetical protein